MCRTWSSATAGMYPATYLSYASLVQAVVAVGRVSSALRQCTGIRALSVVVNRVSPQHIKETNVLLDYETRGVGLVVVVFITTL